MRKKEEADSYFTVLHQTETLIDKIKEREALIDHINYLPARMEDTLDKCAELYENPYDVQELGAHYEMLKTDLTYALRLIEGSILEQENVVQKAVEEYKNEHDVAYKHRQEIIAQTLMEEGTKDSTIPNEKAPF